MFKSKIPTPSPEVEQADAEREDVRRANAAMLVELEHANQRVDEVLERLRRRVRRGGALQLVRAR